MISPGVYWLTTAQALIAHFGRIAEQKQRFRMAELEARLARQRSEFERELLRIQQLPKAGT